MDVGAAIDYLAPKIPHRPLWQGRAVNGNPLYSPPCSNRKGFTSSLRNQYATFFKNNRANYKDGKTQLPKGSDGKIDYSEEFLNTVVDHYNRPDIPSGYALAEHIDHNLPRNIELQFKTKLQFKTIGVEVLDEGGRERTAYPEAFLRIVYQNLNSTYKPEQGFDEDLRMKRYQSVIQSSIAAYHAYLTDLCQVPLALAQSISGGKAKVFSQVTKACMNIDSLELQITNWKNFMAAQNATDQAGS